MTHSLSTKTYHKPTRQNPDAASIQLGKMPPQAPELEQAVLGVLMLEQSAPDTVFPILQPDDFYVDAHQKVYSAIVSVFTSGARPDILTVTAQLRKQGDLDIVGGAYYVTQLTNGVVTGENLLKYCLLVKECSLKRQTILIAGTCLAEAYDPGTDALELLSKAQITLSKLQEGLRGQQMAKFGDVAMHTLQAMEKAAANPTDLLGLPTGLAKLDEIILGLTCPDLIIIAGGTGEGKSTLALQMAMHIGTKGSPVAFFSLEMKNNQMMWKVFSATADAEVKNIRRGALAEEQWHKLHARMQDFQKANIFMHDIGGLNIHDLKSILRGLVAKHGIKVAFIDYLQLISGEGAGKTFGIREQEVNYVSKQLKQLAMELNIPIVALAQLNRMEKGAKRLYRLSDLRESGSLEQDADGVVFVWNPAMHQVTSLSAGDPPFLPGQVLLHIAKWRLGDTGTVPMMFNGRYSRFETMEERWSTGGSWKPLRDLPTIKPHVPPTPVPSDMEPQRNEELPF